MGQYSFWGSSAPAGQLAAAQKVLAQAARTAEALHTGPALSPGSPVVLNSAGVPVGHVVQDAEAQLVGAGGCWPTPQTPAEQPKYSLSHLARSCSSDLGLRASLPLSSPEAPSSPHIPASPASSMQPEAPASGSLEPFSAYKELLRQAHEDNRILKQRLQTSVDRNAEFCHQVVPGPARPLQVAAHASSQLLSVLRHRLKQPACSLWSPLGGARTGA